jgi:phospholipase/lecithinase/hemolysin
MTRVHTVSPDALEAAIFGAVDIERRDDLHPKQDGHDLMAGQLTDLARNPDHSLGRTFTSVLTGISVREGEGARRLPAPLGLDTVVPR